MVASRIDTSSQSSVQSSRQTMSGLGGDLPQSTRDDGLEHRPKPFTPHHDPNRHISYLEAKVEQLQGEKEKLEGDVSALRAQLQSRQALLDDADENVTLSDDSNVQLRLQIDALTKSRNKLAQDLELWQERYVMSMSINEMMVQRNSKLELEKEEMRDASQALLKKNQEVQAQLQTLQQILCEQMREIDLDLQSVEEPFDRRMLSRGHGLLLEKRSSPYQNLSNSQQATPRSALADLQRLDEVFADDFLPSTDSGQGESCVTHQLRRTSEHPSLAPRHVSMITVPSEGSQLVLTESTTESEASKASDVKGLNGKQRNEIVLKSQARSRIPTRNGRPMSRNRVPPSVQRASGRLEGSEASLMSDNILPEHKSQSAHNSPRFMPSEFFTHSQHIAHSASHLSGIAPPMNLIPGAPAGSHAGSKYVTPDPDKTTEVETELKLLAQTRRRPESTESVHGLGLRLSPSSAVADPDTTMSHEISATTKDPILLFGSTNSSQGLACTESIPLASASEPAALGQRPSLIPSASTWSTRSASSVKTSVPKNLLPDTVYSAAPSRFSTPVFGPARGTLPQVSSARVKSTSTDVEAGLDEKTTDEPDEQSPLVSASDTAVGIESALNWAGTFMASSPVFGRDLAVSMDEVTLPESMTEHKRKGSQTSIESESRLRLLHHREALAALEGLAPFRALEQHQGDVLNADTGHARHESSTHVKNGMSLEEDIGEDLGALLPLIDDGIQDWEEVAPGETDRGGFAQDYEPERTSALLSPLNFSQVYSIGVCGEQDEALGTFGKDFPTCQHPQAPVQEGIVVLVDPGEEDEPTRGELTDAQELPSRPAKEQCNEGDEDQQQHAFLRPSRQQSYRAVMLHIVEPAFTAAASQLNRLGDQAINGTAILIDRLSAASRLPWPAPDSHVYSSNFQPNEQPWSPSELNKFASEWSVPVPRSPQVVQHEDFTMDETKAAPAVSQRDSVPPSPLLPIDIVTTLTSIPTISSVAFLKSLRYNTEKFFRTCYVLALAILLFSAWMERSKWRDANFSQARYDEVVRWNEEYWGLDWPWLEDQKMEIFRWLGGLDALSV